MRKMCLVAMMLSVAACQPQGAKDGSATATTPGAAATPQSEDQKTLYALGLSIGKSISVFEMTPEELEYVKAGLTAQVKGEKPAVELETYGPKLQELARARSTQKAEKEKENSKKFLDEASKESGATKTESGLVYKELTAGTGDSPKATDIVKVHYKGTLPNGTEFDSSYKRGEPTQFPLQGVIKCWTEGVQKMKVGGKAKLVCPSDIAYGDRGAPPNIPGGSALVFEVELLEIVKPPEAPAAGAPGAPGAPATPPSAAQKK
ncbi:FKBP-type peptidyl-prolyl cis-trans isomerase [Myxococcus sp. CA051A]|uniref:Peptidyl-prolyl cis-trans isomerase n=1 Tax=Myxococcus llanfairpwllgwyngyllgogerychwyrndrobwllllantysiliogogogochensis TaxID=2590453 RepID=A0A540WV64_9BACT|nr:MULTISPECIES: FKBP-type peptidyl-prolyl cis-trans isomerase [Myxococcus]NTX07381.1 FKBP-type peptidyl-prolyl cis-trans isomerase [Myxococcus sp. CA040A]NTX10952.1 FKBP-type peptidyl-prolyl cis-trans isomerase [Myxococcus sp. CA056]NTX37158.1 FKBP-type peptidyl-prolyl cis-trans isomerase [Myxococcus sp. CA033]NTX52092.1 FKBP-type peptidyl-prolyl cis-trans isomerase [Myxococcus sp. CA039A]NTX60228.1 FKBP-type peptidyl-prolyl cis-trans isomerase [Myxococcus sp. CA051A]